MPLESSKEAMTSRSPAQVTVCIHTHAPPYILNNVSATACPHTHQLQLAPLHRPVVETHRGRQDADIRHDGPDVLGLGIIQERIHIDLLQAQTQPGWVLAAFHESVGCRQTAEMVILQRTRPFIFFFSI